MRTNSQTGGLHRLLVIDDDEGITDFIKHVTEDMNFSVNCVHDHESIGSTYHTFNPDIIFLDLCMPGYDGIEVLHFLSDLGCKSKIFLISGMDKITLESAGEVGRQCNLNIAGVLSKPFMIEDIQQALGRELESLSTFTSDQLQTLLGNGEFEIRYIPRMAIKTLAGSAIAAVEVRVFWIDRHGRDLPFHELKPKLHSLGILNSTGHSILNKALETYKGWLEQEMDIDLAISLEDEMTLDPALPAYLVNIVNKWGVDSSRITIGISDKAALSKAPILLDMLTRLRIKGFNLSVETSGSDSTDLNQLVHLPFNEVKLESKTIESLCSNIDSEFNVSTLISLADKLGLSTCADGVNSEANFRFIYNCGCTVAQGEYFSKPLKHNELENFDISAKYLSTGSTDQLRRADSGH